MKHFLTTPYTDDYFNSSVQILESAMTSFSGGYMLNFLKELPNCFQSGHRTLRPYQRCGLWQLTILAHALITSLTHCHHGGCEMASHCGLDLHFSNPLCVFIFHYRYRWAKCLLKGFAHVFNWVSFSWCIFMLFLPTYL